MVPYAGLRTDEVIRVALDQTLDVLALAGLEEADEVRDEVGADPLSFHWALPVPQ